MKNEIFIIAKGRHLNAYMNWNLKTSYLIKGLGLKNPKKFRKRIFHKTDKSDPKFLTPPKGLAKKVRRQIEYIKNKMYDN